MEVCVYIGYGILCVCVCVCLHLVLLAGALYNIVRVPPEKADSTESLQGATVLCSIMPANKSHPSYYHSFGESPRAHGLGEPHAIGYHDRFMKNNSGYISQPYLIRR